MSGVASEQCPALMLFAGESRADRLCRFVRSVAALPCSLTSNVEVLKALVRRGVTPENLRSWEWRTNCAESAIGFIAACCATVDCARDVHHLLAAPSVIGTSIARVYQLGEELGVMSVYTGPESIRRGCLVSYAHGQHVEWVLSDVDPVTGMADHGGGGRADNAITVGRGDVRSSLGRPATEVFAFALVLPESPYLATGELDTVLHADATGQAEGG